MTGSLWGYLLIFLGSLSGCLLLTPFALRLAIFFNIYDQPTSRKIHKAPVPHIGGVAIVTTFSIAILIASKISSPDAGSGQINLILGLALFLAFVGLIDDLKGISPLQKIISQFICAICICLAGDGVSIFQIEVLDWSITVLWVVGITNAFNLLDNMDGLTAGLAGIASLAFFGIAALNDQYLVASLSLALAGCALGFLKKNYHPAEIFMGDGGSLFLGFLISYIGLKLRFDSPISRSFLVPITICAVAVIDTTLVVCSRLLKGSSPFQGGQDHLSHRLLKLGFSIPNSVRSIYSLSLIVATASVFIARSASFPAWFLLITIWLILLFIFFRALRVSTE